MASAEVKTNTWEIQSSHSTTQAAIVDGNEEPEIPQPSGFSTDVIFTPGNEELQDNIEELEEENPAFHNESIKTDTPKSRESKAAWASGHNTILGSVGVAFRSLFRWGRRGLRTHQITPESGSNFLSPQTASSNPVAVSNRQDDNIVMKTLNAAGNYANPTYSDNVAEEQAEMGLDHVYESMMYPVNSAGNPVPITIDESRNYVNYDISTSDGDDSGDNDDVNSKSRLRPKRAYSCRSVAIAIWRKTYRPDSTFIYYWMLLVTLAVLYNAWTIPLRAGFIIDIQTPWQGIWFAFDAISDLIYVIDIVIRFRTRLYSQGVYARGISLLTRRHRKEWTVILDFVSVFPTDLFFVESINPYYRMNRVVRFYRAYTFYRMVELKTRWPNAWRAANLLHFVVLVLHYNTCIYYAVCVVNGYGTLLTSWSYPDPQLYPEYAELTRRYTHSFYWSLQALSSIGGRPLPESDWQYAYTIYLNLIGIALTAFIIGYFTTLLMGSNSEKFDFEHAMETTRRFMKKRKLPKDLRERVEQFYYYMWTNSEFGHLDEDKLFRHLPVSIKQDMSYYENYAALKRLPELSNCDSSILRSLVMKMKRRSYLPGQFVYRSGDAGTEMYVVGDGVLQVIRERDGNVSGAKAGDVFGEMNIFNLRRNHRRSCDVLSCGYSELYVLTSDDVNETLSKYPRVMNLVMQQARRQRAVIRRRMSSNFYKRHSQEKFLLGNNKTSSVDPPPSLSNVQLSMGGSASMRVTVQENGQGTSQDSNGRQPEFGHHDDSPDSGMPSSPARRQISETEFTGVSGVRDIGMILRPDIAEKLTAVYHRNLQSLQHSLDAVWYNEVASLKQQLAATESERDNKAREAIQLRRRLEKGAEQTNSSTTNTTSFITEEQNDILIDEEEGGKAQYERKRPSPKHAKVSNQNMQSNSKLRTGTRGTKRRTILPTTTSSTISLKNDVSDATTSSSVINQTRRASLIQETPLNVYGSLTSLN